MTNDKAFPNPHRTDETGMTLRDYFAAKAMEGFLVDLSCEPEHLPSIAVSAYMMADAMMKAREL
jgi:hypothetical protein